MQQTHAHVRTENAITMQEWCKPIPNAMLPIELKCNHDFQPI